MINTLAADGGALSSEACAEYPATPRRRLTDKGRARGRRGPALDRQNKLAAERVAAGMSGTALARLLDLRDAYFVQATAAAINPTWSWTTTADSIAQIQSFETGSGPPPSSPPMRALMGVGQ